MTDEFIERQILTGLIVSTDYVQQIHPAWDPRLLSSPTGKVLAGWCIDYYDQYKKAPNKDIQGIYEQQLKTLSTDRAEWIGDVLESLSDEFDRQQFNTQYLVDQTRLYFKERNLRNFADDITDEVDTGNVSAAEEIAHGYKAVASKDQSGINPFSLDARSVIRQAFAERAKPLIKFPKSLGDFWNQELTRDGFVAVMGPEKRGKTFMLMEIAMQGLMTDCNVVFFQAGDMTEKQQIRRLGIYLTMRSDEERYCEPMLIPVVDCIENQLDTCDKDERECKFGVFSGSEMKEMSYNLMEKAYQDNPDYRACRNCKGVKGTAWVEQRNKVPVLKWREALEAFITFGTQYPSRFKLSTYPNGTLTVSEIKTRLSIWERQDGFIPDVIVIDYADILAADADFNRMEFRHQKNELWQRLRNLSQEKHCLVVTATQAAATSYDKKTMQLNDFSEDKRQYGHVTAMYGLNQTAEEKKIGIMRLNEIVIRDSDYDSDRCVHVLQRLQMGKPFLGSFR